MYGKAINQPQMSFLGCYQPPFVRQDLSLAWSSLSKPRWLAGDPGSLLSFPLHPYESVSPSPLFHIGFGDLHQDLMRA